MPRLLVTLCTYNERENLGRLVPAILAVVPEADVLVIDDASPDGTGRLADGLAVADGRVKTLHRAGKLGLGSATVAAFRFGIDGGYDLLLNMDADFSHPPAAIPALLELADRADVAIGSRYVPGGAVEGWSALRHVMSWGVNTLSRTLLGLPTRDCSGAFRCYRVELLRRIDLGRITAAGYAFEEEILFRCRRAGGRLAETPITFVDRCAGASKINPKEVARALRDLAKLGLERARTPARPHEDSPAREARSL